VHEWLEEHRSRLAAAVGDDPSLYDLDDQDVEQLLELARVAAHESEARTNAPLISYLVGLARGRHADTDLQTLVNEALGKRT
jgi:uncharacterized protein DUF6457